VRDLFCFQCEEALKNQGCVTTGICGKSGEVAELQDLLIYVMKGISYRSEVSSQTAKNPEEIDSFLTEQLFATITNVNFDPEYFIKAIGQGIALRDAIEVDDPDSLPDACTWVPVDEEDLIRKAGEVGVLSTDNEDVRSLRELLTIALKGVAAYYSHAVALGFSDSKIPEFMRKALASTLKDLSMDEMVELVLECGKVGVDVMALLDKANTSSYGHPDITQVDIGVRKRPGILISGHDLLDLEELLKQTEGQGIDVYTHGEMLPANAYPGLKRYDHLAGNYGGSWWHQKEEFESFNGPILMTTNCLVPPKDSYKDRVYTTGAVGFPDLTHIPDRNGKEKDFSQIIEHAKTCPPPTQIETGKLTIGLARKTVLDRAADILRLVSEGKIKRFIVMAGCDGRHKERAYYTEFAEALPNDTVILTAGCAKYRYNKLPLGDIEGFPRVMDAGQCNDSYSLVAIAQALAEALNVGINDLPISYNIAWYEQKAVTVLLALLYLGVKDITLGPRLPAFVSPNVLDVLVKEFNIRKNTTVEEDLPLLVPEVKD
jgi:hydroxylamine reductase